MSRTRFPRFEINEGVSTKVTETERHLASLNLFEMARRHGRDRLRCIIIIGSTMALDELDTERKERQEGRKEENIHRNGNGASEQERRIVNEFYSTINDNEGERKFSVKKRERVCLLMKTTGLIWQSTATEFFPTSLGSIWTRAAVGFGIGRFEIYNRIDARARISRTPRRRRRRPTNRERATPKLDPVTHSPF